MFHPLEKFCRRPACWPIFALLLAITLWLGTKAGGEGFLYNTYIARQGIVSMELAGSKAKAEEIKNFWSIYGAKQKALDSLYYDNFFLLFYSTTLAIACLLAAMTFKVNHPQIYIAGLLLAWAQWIAAFFDAVENFALWKILTTTLQSETYPRLAQVSAMLKFSIIISGIVYAVSPGVLWLTRPIRVFFKYSYQKIQERYFG